MKLSQSIILGLCVAAHFSWANSSCAQSTEGDLVLKGQIINEEQKRSSFRKHSSHQSLTNTTPPIKSSGFKISPTLTLIQGYNDNILAAENKAKGDFYTGVGGSLLIDKSLGRHYMGINLQGKTNYFFSESNENISNFKISASGNLEAHSSLLFPVKFSYGSNYIDRAYTRIEQITQKPIEYTNKTARVGMIYQPNRFRFEIEGRYEAKRQESGFFLNSDEINSSYDKSHNHLANAMRLSYQAKTGWEPFIEAEYARNDYLEDDFDYANIDGVSRDNTFSKIMIGTLFDFKGLLTGMIGLGSGTYEYNDPNIKNGNPLSIQSQIIWRPSQRMKLELDFRKRNIEDNLLAANIDETYGAAGIEYEIKKNLYSHLGLGYLTESFTGFNRDDHLFTLDFGLQYQLTSTLEIHGEYSFKKRKSDQSNYSYNQNILFLGIRKIF